MDTDRKIGMLRELLSLKPSVRNYAQISMLVKSPSIPLEMREEYRRRMDEEYLVKTHEQLLAMFSSQGSGQPIHWGRDPQQRLHDWITLEFVYMKRGMQEEYGGVWDAPSGVFHYLGTMKGPKNTLHLFEVVANEEVLTGE